MLAAGAFAYSVLFPGPVASVLRDALILAVLGVIAEEMSVEVSDRVTLTAANLPILLAVMYTGRLPAILVVPRRRGRRAGMGLGRETALRRAPSQQFLPHSTAKLLLSVRFLWPKPLPVRHRVPRGTLSQRQACGGHFY